jgi:pimeloyl-ACP methyl ester carboxylesterase
MAMKYPKKVKKLVTMGACIFVGKSVVAKKTFNKVNKIINALKKDSSTTSQNTIRLYNLLLTEPRHTFEELKLISCPVLIMAGENDIIKTEHTKGIAANISQSQLLIIPKENHYYPIENSNNFNAHVLKFLGSR